VGNIIWNDWRPLPFTFLKEEDVSRLLHWTNKINQPHIKQRIDHTKSVALFLVSMFCLRQKKMENSFFKAYLN